MESATNLTLPSTSFQERYSAFRLNPICTKDQSMKNINTLSMHGEKFYQLHTDTTIAVATSKYSGKTDPSEIERTNTIRKQQAYFY